MSDKLFEQILRDLNEMAVHGEIASAKSDPVAYKLTRLMGGNSSNWRYHIAGKDRRGREIRYAWSTKRNVAGYFLGWREIVTKGQITRDQWFAKRVKRKVIEKQRERADKFRAKRDLV